MDLAILILCIANFCLVVFLMVHVEDNKNYSKAGMSICLSLLLFIAKQITHHQRNEELETMKRAVRKWFNS